MINISLLSPKPCHCCSFVLVKEGLAILYESFRLRREALAQYDELQSILDL